MVRRRLKSEVCLLTDMKVPWEIAEASVEPVQPSDYHLRKVFRRWDAAKEELDNNCLYCRCTGHPRRSLSHSGEPSLRNVEISPDFSSFSPNNHKKLRERSSSCPMGPRNTPARRRKNTDFESIVRDISDDSLYLRFKNGNSSSHNIDSNNNATSSNSSSPPLSLASGRPAERKEVSLFDDDIWTDISLEADVEVKERSQAKYRVFKQRSHSTTIFEDGCADATEEYWRFTKDVYRTLAGDDAPQRSPAIDRQDSGIDAGPDDRCGDRCRLSVSSRDSLDSGTNMVVSSPATEDKAKLMDELLHDIYPDSESSSPNFRRRSESTFQSPGSKEKKRLVRFHSESGGFTLNIEPLPEENSSVLRRNLTEEKLQEIRNWELVCLVEELRSDILECGKRLVSELQNREDLTTRRQESCDVLTAYLQASSEKRSEDTQMKFSVEPGPGDSGFTEWATAMKMVARLPEGVPQHFRKTLWLTLAEKHLSSRDVRWQQTERALFSESCNPGDEELSVQIVKDLHRTGCSLFCGVSGQHNQAVLKRVLLAFARWNKNVGYCQGLNMLAALILQVMQGSQTSTVKVMIYLIEGVLPESYFGQNLRGLSVDMAVFRDLLRLKMPHLSKHLDQLQHESKEAGTCYEPPLMDVFTMQWFLTIFSNCLPQTTVLRVWDLLFLEGNEILLKTALAIWQFFSDRILAVKSADEFYSSMAVYTREMLELGFLDPNSLIRAIDTVSVPEVAELRERYVYNITPWTVATVAKKGLRLLYDPYDSDDDQQTNNWSDGADSRHRESKMTPFSNHPDREKIALDISTLKKQYLRLRERQRQAHIIFTAACSSDTMSTSTSPTLNHLLLGKSALLSMKGRRIEGTIPPPLNKGSAPVEISGETLHWRDTSNRQRRRDGQMADLQMGSDMHDDASSIRSRSASVISSSSSSSSSTELCDDSSESGDDHLPDDQLDQHYDDQTDTDKGPDETFTKDDAAMISTDEVAATIEPNKASAIDSEKLVSESSVTDSTVMNHEMSSTVNAILTNLNKSSVADATVMNHNEFLSKTIENKVAFTDSHESSANYESLVSDYQAMNHDRFVTTMIDDDKLTLSDSNKSSANESSDFDSYDKFVSMTIDHKLSVEQDKSRIDSETVAVDESVPKIKIEMIDCDDAILIKPSTCLNESSDCNDTAETDTAAINDDMSHDETAKISIVETDINLTMIDSSREMTNDKSVMIDDSNLEESSTAMIDQLVCDKTDEGGVEIRVETAEIVLVEKISDAKIVRCSDDALSNEADQQNEIDETAEAGGKRRNSERALMQILRENSEILRRIQSQSAIRTIEESSAVEEDGQREQDDIISQLKMEVYRNSVRSLERRAEEPEDIAEIRRKYAFNKQWSLDASSTNRRSLTETPDKPRSLDLCSTAADAGSHSVRTFAPFPSRSPRKSRLGVQLGLYSPQDER